MNNVKKQIRVYKSEEDRVVIRDIYERKDLFFESFCQAAKVIKNIVEQSYDFNKQSNEKKLDRGIRLMNYPNNIVTFCGNRGQGKTSAMISMSSSLSQLEKDYQKNEMTVESFWDSYQMTETKFIVITPPIDPSMMRDKASLMREIVSKLFFMVQDKYEEKMKYGYGSYSANYRNTCKEQREEFLVKCQECYSCITVNDTYSFDSNYLDDLQNLARQGDSHNFKEMFYELVKAFLNFMTDADSKHSMLVLQIDDADVKTKNVYDLVEELRRYCVIPNVVVLMAFHEKTLNRAIEQYYLKSFRDLIDQPDSSMDFNKCVEITGQYMKKFLPTTHRIYLPNINHYIRDIPDSIQLFYTLDESDNKNILEGNKKILASGKMLVSYQEQLIYQVFIKTGIILIAEKDKLHPFLPHRMRELTQFLALINNMDDAIFCNREILGDNFSILKAKEEKARQYISTRLQNLQKLEEYFLKDWCKIRLTDKQQNIIYCIYEAAFSIKNQTAIRVLADYITDITGEEFRTDMIKEFPNQISRETVFSDVLRLLDEAKEYLPKDEYTNSFLYAVRMQFTFSFHQAALNDMLRYKSERGYCMAFKSLVNLTGGRMFPFSYYKEKTVNESVYSAIVFIEKFSSISNSLEVVIYNRLLYGITGQKDSDTSKWEVDWMSPVLIKDENKYTWNENFNSAFIDGFKPIIGFIMNIIIPEQGELLLENEQRMDISACLDVICNLDIWELLHRKFFQAMPKMFVNNSKSSLTALLSNYADTVHQSISEEILVHSQANDKETWNRIFGEKMDFSDLNFLDETKEKQSLEETKTNYL